MREGVLFEITKDHLEKGLNGFPVGYCVTSHVDPLKGISYIGRPVAELSSRDPLEIMYLLFYGESGSANQLSGFRQEIAKRATFKKETLEQIRSLPVSGDPLDVFASSLFIAGILESKDDYIEDCLHVIAKLPEIAATVINIHAKWGETPSSCPDLDYIENFLAMLLPPLEKPKELISAMRLFHILNQDPGGGHLSAFVGKMTASGLQNMYGSLAASMASMSFQTKKMRDCLAFLENALNEIGDQPTQQEIIEWMQYRWEQKDPFLGFGHPVLRSEDSRAAACYQYCQKHFPHSPLVKIATLLRSAGVSFLKEKGRLDSHVNFDMISGVLLKCAGFPFPEYYPVLAGMSHCIGIAIQIMYERALAKEGQGAPVLRPAYLYKHRL